MVKASWTGCENVWGCRESSGLHGESPKDVGLNSPSPSFETLIQVAMTRAWKTYADWQAHPTISIFISFKSDAPLPDGHQREAPKRRSPSPPPAGTFSSPRPAPSGSSRFCRTQFAIGRNGLWRGVTKAPSPGNRAECHVVADDVSRLPRLDPVIWVPIQEPLSMTFPWGFATSGPVPLRRWPGLRRRVHPSPANPRGSRLSIQPQTYNRSHVSAT